jgi:hypothetical protein
MRRAISVSLLSSALLAAAALNASATPIGITGSGGAHRSAVIRIGDDDGYDRRDGRRYRNGRGGVVVDGPYARVDAGDPIVVDAPFAHVRVGRRIRVRAPFVNLSIPR